MTSSFLVTGAEFGLPPEGVSFLTLPCATGFASNGPSTAAGAAREIRRQGLRDLRVLDLCCGVGVIGILMAKLLPPEAIAHLTLADINVFSVECARVNAARLLRMVEVRPRGGERKA